MAESRHTANMWYLILHSREQRSRTAHAVDPLLPAQLLRLVVDDEHGCILSSDEDKTRDDRECLAELMVAKGIISLTTNVTDTFIKSESTFAPGSTSSFQLQPSDETHTTSVLLRSMDRVNFGAHKLELLLRPGNSKTAQPVSEPADARVEVKSSGTEADIDHTGSDAETDDDDAPNKTSKPLDTQVTGEPFSTAQSTLLAVQETPKAQRSAVTVEIPAADSAVLAVSQSASNRGRKRAQPEVDDDAVETEEMSAAQPSKRRKGQKASSYQSRSAPKSSSSTAKKTSTPPSSATPRPNAPSTYYQVVCSGIGELDKKTKAFLLREKVVVSDDLPGKPRADKTLICCVPPGELKTTAKVLKALAQNVPIVSTAWIDASVAAEAIVEPSPYAAVDAVDRSKVFADKTLIFTRAAKKAYIHGYSDVVNVLLATGAEKTKISAAKEVVLLDDNDIVVGLDENDPDVVALMEKDMKCFSRELISASIVQGVLLDDEQGYLLGGETTSTKPMAKTTKKKGRKSSS